MIRTACSPSFKKKKKNFGEKKKHSGENTSQSPLSCVLQKEIGKQ